MSKHAVLISFLLTHPNTNTFIIQNQTDVELGMKAAKNAGLKVFRTWGFNDMNATFNPNGLPKYGGEGAGPSRVYFQSWDDGKPTINYGPTGLQAFDKVVRAAENTGIKLVVALTNNVCVYIFTLPFICPVADEILFNIVGRLRRNGRVHSQPRRKIP